VIVKVFEVAESHGIPRVKMKVGLRGVGVAETRPIAGLGGDRDERGVIPRERPVRLDALRGNRVAGDGDPIDRGLDPTRRLLHRAVQGCIPRAAVAPAAILMHLSRRVRVSRGPRRDGDSLTDRVSVSEWKGVQSV
jgi:hypothetical protein